MALQIRRGTDAQRQAIRFNAGELVYTTDYKDLFVGDGTTNGGVRVAPIKSLNGLDGAAADGALTITTDDIDAGATNKYYSSTQARIDAGAALVAGNVGNTGISFTYHNGDNTITAVVTAGGYSLPTAAPTELGGVKISQGGLAIDGAGLLSVVTPVSAGVAGHLTYYTSVNAVGDVGTGLTWKTTQVQLPGFVGGELSVDGLIDVTRIQIARNLTNGGLFIATQNDGLAESDTFSISTAHTNATEPVAMNLFRSRGTIASPTAIQTNDQVFNIRFLGRTPGSTLGAGLVAQLGAKVTGTVGDDVTPGELVVTLQNQAGELVEGLTVSATTSTFATQVLFPDGTAADPSIAFTTDGGTDTGLSHPGDGIIVVSSNATEVARFDGGGIRSSGFIKVADVSGTLPNPPEAGMIVLDGTTFKGYNGSAWVNLN